MMDELLKAKYYDLVGNKDYAHYEMIGNILATMENKMICSNNIVAMQELIDTVAPIQPIESEVYNELEKDIKNGLFDGGSNDGTK